MIVHRNASRTCPLVGFVQVDRYLPHMQDNGTKAACAHAWTLFEGALANSDHLAPKYDRSLVGVAIDDRRFGQGEIVAVEYKWRDTRTIENGPIQPIKVRLHSGETRCYTEKSAGANLRLLTESAASAELRWLASSELPQTTSVPSEALNPFVCFRAALRASGGILDMVTSGKEGAAATASAKSEAARAIQSSWMEAKERKRRKASTFSSTGA